MKDARARTPRRSSTGARDRDLTSSSIDDSFPVDDSIPAARRARERSRERDLGASFAI